MTHTDHMYCSVAIRLLPAAKCSSFLLKTTKDSRLYNGGRPEKTPGKNKKINKWCLQGGCCPKYNSAYLLTICSLHTETFFLEMLTNRNRLQHLVYHRALSGKTQSKLESESPLTLIKIYKPNSYVDTNSKCHLRSLRLTCQWGSGLLDHTSMSTMKVSTFAFMCCIEKFLGEQDRDVILGTGTKF